MSTLAQSKRRLLTNATANWVGFAAQVAVALVLSPILIDGLGNGRYGIWSLVESILAYLMLFDLGVAASVVRNVARFETTHDRESLNRVFNTSLLIFLLAGLAAYAVVVILVLSGISVRNLPGHEAREASGMLLLLGLNLAMGLPLGVFPAVLDGLERYPAKTAIRTAALLLRSGVFVGIVRQGGGLIDLAWVITVCNVVEHLVLAGAACWYLPGLRIAPRYVDRATFRDIRGYSFHAFLALIAGRVSFQTDALVIGAFLAPQYIAFFVIAARLVEYAKNALRALTAVLTPTISALDARGESESVRRVLVDVTRWVLWLVLPIEAGLLVLGKPFLTQWLGPEYAEASYPTLAILAAPLGLALAQSVAARILYGLGKLQWFVRVVIAEALVNLLLSVLLVRTFGIEGVAWGTSIPNVFANLVVMVFVCRTIGVAVGEYARRSLTGPVLASTLLASAWLLAQSRWEPNSWFELFAIGVTGLASYATLAAITEWLIEPWLELKFARKQQLTFSP